VYQYSSDFIDIFHFINVNSFIQLYCNHVENVFRLSEHLFLYVHVQISVI